MLKIGIIGLGDIAQKAYLPVISRKHLEVHLFTRNETVRAQLSEQYRFKNVHATIESLINSGISGAFVHTATSAHYEIAQQLLHHNIHVYIDKPVTPDYPSTEKLVNLAVNKNLLLMAGFNRRYAPCYQKLKELPSPNMVVMQKNRPSLPGEVRTFVFDDFIHVVDTLLYLFPHPIQSMIVTGKKKDNLLYHVILQLTAADGSTAIGIMNRDSGTTEERLEVFASSEKRVAHNLETVVIHRDKHEQKIGTQDWEPTLRKRGFEQITEAFLQAIGGATPPVTAADEILLTHKICEEVVARLSVG